jgi:hypothetical protein
MNPRLLTLPSAEISGFNQNSLKAACLFVLATNRQHSHIAVKGIGALLRWCGGRFLYGF